MHVLTDKFAAVLILASIILLVITFTQHHRFLYIINILIGLILTVFGIMFLVMNIYYVFIFGAIFIGMTIIGFVVATNIAFFKYTKDSDIE
jgi:hypothetical protein